LKVLVGRWALNGDADKKSSDQLLEAGADQVGTTLEESVAQLVQLQQLIRSREAPAETPMLPIPAADGPVAAQRSA
jgi:hypothetical protein